jgi:trans-feruloyl-CoA hydratase/vanillin synthase
MSAYKTVKIEREDGITFVILNRPEKRNAMNPTMHYEMLEVWDELEFDAETKIVVLTGAGDSWCAGQDLKESFLETANNPLEHRRSSWAASEWRWRRLYYFPKPTIAMVNGYCFGGGFTQVCACDLAVAADDALFGLSEVNWGILPGGIVSWNVAQMLNLRDGMYYALTGDTFDGKKAKDMGFINFSFPRNELKQETMKMAQKLMEKSPAVLRYTKEALRAVRFMNEPQAADYLNAKSDALRFVDKEDSRTQGMRQFLDDKSYRPGFGAFRRDKATRA